MRSSGLPSVRLIQRHPPRVTLGRRTTQDRHVPRPGSTVRGGRVTPDQERLVAAYAGRLVDALPNSKLARLPEETFSGQPVSETPSGCIRDDRLDDRRIRG